MRAPRPLSRRPLSPLRSQPYQDYVQSRRANKLADAYPMYTRSIVKDFGRSQPLRGPKFNPLNKQW